jgi:hypothetical protein
MVHARGLTGPDPTRRFAWFSTSMRTESMMQSAPDRITRALLVAGIIAGPLYLVVGIGQALTREGFDMRQHALSLLSNGRLGWIQIANFLGSGLLVIGGALGLRRALQGHRGGTWGPILLGIYGVGLIGAGIFVADPGLGFPPGTPKTSSGLSRSGLLHFAFGGIGFYGIIAACFVFARRFHSLGRVGWTVFCVLTGVLFFLSFAAIASGSKAAVTILGFYGAVAWLWGWHSALLARVLHDLPQYKLKPIATDR